MDTYSCGSRSFSIKISSFVVRPSAFTYLCTASSLEKNEIVCLSQVSRDVKAKLKSLLINFPHAIV